MKAIKLRRVLLALIIAMSILPRVQAETCPNEKITIFVQNGAEDGDGSFETPFGGLEEARDFIRKMKDAGHYPAKGVTVNFREGTYFTESGFQFDAADSGTEEGPVTYQAYGTEKVVFTGGVSLAVSEFKPPWDAAAIARIRPEVKNKILAIDLNTKGISSYGNLNPYGWGSHNFWASEGNYLANEMAAWMGFTPQLSEIEIFQDGQTMTLARYPNGTDMSSIKKLIDFGMHYEDWAWTVKTSDYSHYGTYTTPDGKPKVRWEDVYGFTVQGDDVFTERMKGWRNATDVWSYGYWSYNWADLAGKIKSFDFDEGTFTMHHPYVASYDPRPGQRFYFYNLLEELDIPGEWYLDRDSGILYFYPPSSADLTISLLEAPVFAVNGASNIEFRKFNLQAGRKQALWMNDAENILLELCEIGMFGDKAVWMDNASNFRCYSNYFYDVRTGGIWSDGGSVNTLTPSGNIYENNWFRNYSRDGRPTEAAFMLYGVGDTVRNNRIHDSDTSAFYTGAPELLIEYNEFYDIMRRMSDMGVGYGYKKHSARGVVLRHNYFHDIATDETNSDHTIIGMYGDEGFSGLSVLSNLFVNFKGRAIMLNGGRDWTVKHNVAVNTDSFGRITAFLGNYNLEEWGEEFGTDFDPYENNPLFEKYPHFSDLRSDEPMKPKYSVIKDNVLFNTAELDFKAFSDVPESYVRENNEIAASLVLTDDPGFEDMSGGNYIIKPDSRIYGRIPDFDAPDFKNMGLYTPWLAYHLRDSLAMATDRNLAYAGFTPIYVDEENRLVTPRLIDDRVYVPVRFIAERLGGSAEYDAEQNRAVIQLGGSGLDIDLSTGAITAGGAVLEGYSAVVDEDRTLVPVRAVEALGKTVTWYEEGIVIVGDGENGIQQEDKQLINELLRRLR
ncbi:MAG: right-handed parallel beta-helix repeat-containing protein [Clostridiales bacterium]|nr:right-handed parallel beta-helix repeat-containing protein [Clostridiales bacterium]